MMWIDPKSNKRPLLGLTDCTRLGSLAGAALGSDRWDNTCSRIGNSFKKACITALNHWTTNLNAYKAEIEKWSGETLQNIVAAARQLAWSKSLQDRSPLDQQRSKRRHAALTSCVATPLVKKTTSMNLANPKSFTMAFQEAATPLAK